MNYYWMYYNIATGKLAPQTSTHPPLIDNDIDPTLIPIGDSVVGPYNDLDNLMPSTFQMAFDNPQSYLYQNNTFVDNPNYATIQLQKTKTIQESLINTGLNQTLNGGFTSKLTGHTYVTTTNGQANMEGDLKRFELNPNLTSVQFFTLDSGWVPHTYQELSNAFLDGGEWKDAQYIHAQDLITQIEALVSQPNVTVEQIQAIVWTEADYIESATPVPATP